MPYSDAGFGDRKLRTARLGSYRNGRGRLLIVGSAGTSGLPPGVLGNGGYDAIIESDAVTEKCRKTSHCPASANGETNRSDVAEVAV
jgi:hypothetical protein